MKYNDEKRLLKKCKSVLNKTSYMADKRYKLVWTILSLPIFNSFIYFGGRLWFMFLCYALSVNAAN